MYEHPHIYNKRPFYVSRVKICKRYNKLHKLSQALKYFYIRFI